MSWTYFQELYIVDKFDTQNSDTQTKRQSKRSASYIQYGVISDAA